LAPARKEIIGKELFDVGILTDKEQASQKFEQLHGKGWVRFEQSLADVNDGVVHRLEFVCNVCQENDKPLIQCNVRDIGERNEDERRLREALQQLAAAKEELEVRVQERTVDLQQRNAELEAFSYSLSHDLRAPIRAIVSFAQLALDEFGKKVGKPGTDYLDKAIGAAERLDRLIQSVLSFSKTTREHVRRESVDVEQLLKDILRERPEWGPPKAEIKIESPLLTVCGDWASLTQCLTNLLDNAMKFLRTDSGARVRIFTRQMGSRVRLCVEDNGLGIPLSAQARVFDLFQRAHNGYEGYGIGLAIVRRAAERMGGTVGLESTPGKGSTFWIELPGAEA
jgi:signal transduction histidine kinase